MQIPFLDLKAHHAPLRAELDSAIKEVIDRGAFSGGPYVDQFEQEFAKFCGVRYAIGVGNGTDALWFALLAAGVKPGDEVITVPMTFMATAEAISFCGAKPVFVDIEENTYTIDATKLEEAITSKTKAIIPVHLYGQVADMNPIIEIAERYRISVIEDACQAHGAGYKGRSAGSIGISGCFSFYPGKNLGAFGEAGGVVTSNEETKRKIQVLRDHGQDKKYHHSMVGWNGRMDGIQGAVLKVKLKGLAAGNEARRNHAKLYNSHILKLTEHVIVPKEAEGRRHVYHVYAVRVKNRDVVLKDLSERGIGCGVHYPVPIHLQPAYSFLGYKEGDFPVSEKCGKEFLSLPMFPELKNSQIETVVEALHEATRSQ
jgi:dTDP-4-amino-4,6-dideoxygalactose transaminase